jgi:hypothetical protein
MFWLSLYLTRSACAEYWICLTIRIATFCRCFAIRCRFWMKFVKDVSVFLHCCINSEFELSALLLNLVEVSHLLGIILYFVLIGTATTYMSSFMTV